MEIFKETPYGDVHIDEFGELTLDFHTFYFEDFSPDIGVDTEIDKWLIDNDYIIKDRSICVHEPDVNSLNYVYYNEETGDYDEVDVPLDCEDTLLTYMLSYKLEKR